MSRRGKPEGPNSNAGQPRSRELDWQAGLQAVRESDRLESRELAAASLNLDEALKAEQPSAPRWDYGVKLRSMDGPEACACVWIEVHPAGSTGNTAEVLKKWEWLKQWLTSQAELNSLTDRAVSGFQYVWIATLGTVRLDERSKIGFGQRGLHFAGRRYNLKKSLPSA